MYIKQGCLRFGGRRGSCFICPLPYGGRIALDTELFLSLLAYEGTFSGVVEGLVQENFSEGEPPKPQLATLQLCDQYTKYCPSRREFEDQNLPLRRNIHIQRCALRGNLAPCLGHAQAPLITEHGKGRRRTRWMDDMVM